MRKTLTALLALSGMAMADMGDVQTKEVDIMNLPASISPITTSPEGWEYGIAYANTIRNTHVAADLSCCPELRAEGWSWGLGYIGSTSLFPNDVSVNSVENSITFHGRLNYAGEFVSCTVDIADLLKAQDDGYALTGLDFTFGVTGDVVIYSVWHWDGTSDPSGTDSLLGNYAMANKLPSEATKYSWRSKDIESGYKDGKILLVFNDDSAGVQNTITDFQAKAIFSRTVEAPEPATGTLSLLALAGLCIRRRK